MKHIVNTQKAIRVDVDIGAYISVQSYSQVSADVSLASLNSKTLFTHCLLIKVFISFAVSLAVWGEISLPRDGVLQAKSPYPGLWKTVALIHELFIF